MAINWREEAKYFADAAANDPENSQEYMWYSQMAEQYAQQEEARQGAAGADVNALIGLGKTAASSAAHWAPMLAMGTGPVGAAVGGIDLLAGHPIGRTVDELLGLPVGEKPTWGDTAKEALTMALLGGQSWPLKAAGGALGLANIVDRGARSQEELANLGVDVNILESVAQSVAGPALPGHLTGGDPVGSVVDTMMFTHGATRNPLVTKAMRAVSEPADIAAARKTFPWLLGPRAFTEDTGTGGATYQYGPTEGGLRIDPRLSKQGEYQEAFRETSPGSAVEPKAPSVLGKLVRMARKVYNPEALTLEDMAKFMGDEKGREIKPGAVNTAKSNKIAVWTDYLREKWLRNEPYESVDEKGRTTQRIDPNEHATAESYIEEVLKHEFGHVLRPDVSEYRATRTGQRAADRGAMYGDLYENAQGMDRPERARRLGGMPEPLEEAQSGAQEPPAPIRQKAVVEQPYQYTPKAGTDYHEALKFMRKSGAISGRSPKATELARMMREQGYDPTFALEAEQRMAEAEAVAAKGSAERTQAQLGVIGWMMNTLGIEGRRNFINGALGREIKGWRDIRESEIPALMDAVTSFGKTMEEQGRPALEIKGGKSFGREIDYRKRQAESASAERTQGQLAGVAQRMNLLGIEGRRNFINGALGREIKGWRDIRESEIPVLHDAMDRYERIMAKEPPAFSARGGGKIKREINLPERQEQQRRYEEDFRNLEITENERYENALRRLVRMDERRRVQQKRKGSLGKIVKPKFSTEKDKEEDKGLLSPSQITARAKENLGWIDRIKGLTSQAKAVLFKRLYPDESYRLGEAGEDVTEKLSSRMAEEAPEVLRDKLTPTDVILNSRDLMGKDVRYEEGRLDKMQALIKAGKSAEAMKLSKKLSSTKNYDTLLLRQTQESLRSGDSVHVDMEGKDTWAAVKNWLLPALRESVLDLGQKIFVHAKGTDASLKELQNEIGRLMGADLNEVEVTNKPIPQGAVLASRPVKATEGAARRRTTAEAALASTGLAEERLEAQRGVEAARGKYRKAASKVEETQTKYAKTAGKYRAAGSFEIVKLPFGSKAEGVFDGHRAGSKNVTNAKPGEPGSLGNPFIADDVRGGKLTRQQAVEKFKEVFLKRVGEDPEYRDWVLSLRGKKVGYYKPNEEFIHLKVVQDWIRAQTASAEESVTRDAVFETKNAVKTARREKLEALTEGRRAVAKRSGVEAMFRKSKDYKPIREELGQALVGEVESADQMRMIKAGRALYPEAKKAGRRLKTLAEAAKHAEVPLEEFGIYKDETGTIIKSKPGKLGLKDAREILQIRDKTAARNFTNELLGKRTVATGESNPVVDAIVRAFGGKELLDNIAKKFNITPETVRAVKAAKTPQDRTKAIRSVIDDLEAAHPFLKFSTEKETESKGWLDKIGTFLKERIAGIQRLTDEWLTSSAQGTEDAFQKAIASLPADNKYVKLANRELRNMTAGVGIGQDIRRRVTNFIDRIDLGKKWDALDENSPLLTKEGVSIAEKLPGYEGKYELDAADQAFLKAVRQLNRFIDKINKKVYGRGYKSRKNYITHIMNNIVEKEDVQHLTTGQRKLVGRAYESFLTTGKTPEMKGAPESVKAVAQKYIDAHEYLVGENAPLMGGAEKAIAGVKEILGSQMEKDLDIKLEELGKTLKPSKAGFIQHRVLATHGKYGMQNLKEVVIRQLLAFERTVPDHVTIRSLQRLFDYTKTTTKDGKEITQRPLGEMLLDPQTYNRLKTDYDLAVAERFYPSKYTEVGKTSWASRMMDKFFGTETGLTPFPNQAAAHHLAGIMYQNRLVRPDFYAMNSTDALFKTSFKYNLLSREGLKDFLGITVGLTKRMSANYAASKFLGGKTSPLVKLAVKYAPSRKNLATLLVSGHSETKGLLGKIPGIPTVRKFFNWGSARIEGQEHVNSMMIWAIEAEGKIRSSIFTKPPKNATPEMVSLAAKNKAAIEAIATKYGSMIEAYAEGGAGRAEVMKLLDAAGKQPGAKLLKTAFAEAVVEMKRDQGHSGGFFSKSPLGYRLTALGKNHLSIFLQVLGKMYTNYPSTLMTQMIRAMSKSEGLAQTVSPTLGLMVLSGMAYGVPVAIANQIEKDPKNRQSAAGLVWGSMWKDMGYPTRLVPLSIAGSIGNILTGRDVKAGAHELASNFMPGYYLGYKTGVWDKIFKENKK